MANSYLGQILIVGVGGFIGSSLRFVIGGAVQRLAMFTTYPLGTLVVYVMGCLLIGFLGGLAEMRGGAGACPTLVSAVRGARRVHYIFDLRF